MSGDMVTGDHAGTDALADAARAGDEAAFAALVEGFRRELHVHCYRMLGSFEDAEDMVQETFLRAWRHREGFEGRSSFRVWLYRIATNACLDVLKRRPLPGVSVTWLQPFPDRLLDGVTADDSDPGAAVVAKESIELAFLIAIQYLPPRQRAALILRDVVGWSAQETSVLLDTSVDSVTSALKRARSTLRKHLPARRIEWAAEADPTLEERRVLQRYMDAHERGDPTALAGVLRADVRLAMPPTLTWYAGRDAVVSFHAELFTPEIQWRFMPVRANRQPAVGFYTRRRGESTYQASVIDVLRIETGLVAQIDAFILPQLFPAFGLPLAL